MKDTFNLKNFLIENKLTPNSLLLKESAVWNWDGDRNSLEQVPPEFKEAVKAALPDLDDETFEAAFDGIKNFHADEAGKGSMRFNSDHWAEQIEMDYLQEDTLGENEEEDLELDRDYDKGGKYYSEDGAEAFRIQPFKMNDIEYTKHEANRMGRYIVGLDGEALAQFISDYMGAFEADKGETEDGKTFNEDQESDHQFYANQEGETVVMEIAKDAINLMDEQPGTSPHLALQSALEMYMEDNDLE
jgi:hypothetical protein